MKLKHLLFSSLMLLSAGTAWADVIINATNFPDVNFRSWLLSQDYSSDRKLTDAEIAGVTSISVSSKSIQSLKGIEYFTALTALWCNTNQLTTLDVSKNTALNCLYCRDNHLTSLNVSGCTALEWLDCHNNQLTSLDVSKNTRLSLLQCYSNQLTSLDVSGCAALTRLDCYGNQLSSLDVSKNTALGTLYCYNNQLTSLNVSKNTKLYSLYCYQNQIKGAAMDVFVSSLPNVGSGTMRVIYNENEQNVMTTTQIAVAKGKGWVPRYYDGSSWREYAGIDPDAIAIDEENFPDAKFRNYLLSLDYGTDGFLTGAEIAGVSQMDVHSKGIQSLQGIEYFTALKRLDCYSNQLTSLDVSKNTALTMLNCRRNQLTFSSLNVSGCIALTTLMCNDNYLTSIDLSRNTALTRLECYSNPLTSLDVSKNTKLDSLYCYSNLLTSLDVSKNTALIYLDCFDNQLTSLDVSKNTALTRLECYNNQLTSLDVSKNTALKYLGCHNNQLTSLDVSKNTALGSLDCHNNQLTSLDVSKNTELTTLRCYSNQLTSLDMSKYTNTKPSYIEYYIACYQNQIKGAAMDALIASLPIRSNSTMRVIYYENEQNEMTITQVSAAKAKGWTPRYTTDGYDWKEYNGAIAINEENFPDAKFRNFLLSRDYGSDGKLTFEEIAKVTSIDVSSKSIRSLKGIEFFTALTELECGGNQLTSLDVSGCTELTELRCYGNQLTSLDVSKNTELIYLSCEVNKLTSLDVSENTALRTLTCNHNNLTSLDVSNNTRLYLLYCYNNQLTSLDVSNKALQYLYCYNNQLTSLDVSNTVLVKLYCYQNQIRGDAMDALVVSLPTVSSREMQVIYNENEQNVMTTTQVTVAKFKGWTPYYTEDGTNWKEYAGVDPSTGVNNVEASDADDSAPWYTINGTLLSEKPTAPGIYIHGGKKVFVK